MGKYRMNPKDGSSFGEQLSGAVSRGVSEELRKFGDRKKVEYLDRSKLRDLCLKWAKKIPSTDIKDIESRLGNKDEGVVKSVVFEVIVGRCLQEIGFSVRGPDQRRDLIKLQTISSDMENSLHWLRRLLFAQRNCAMTQSIGNRWSISRLLFPASRARSSLLMFPAEDGSRPSHPPKKLLINLVEGLLKSGCDYKALRKKLENGELTEKPYTVLQIEQWRLIVELSPKPPSSWEKDPTPVLGIGPATSGVVSGSDAILRSIRKKHKRYREEGAPLIIAVCPFNWVELEDIEEDLFQDIISFSGNPASLVNYGFWGDLYNPRNKSVLAVWIFRLESLFRTVNLDGVRRLGVAQTSAGRPCPSCRVGSKGYRIPTENGWDPILGDGLSLFSTSVSSQDSRGANPSIYMVILPSMDGIKRRRARHL